MAISKSVARSCPAPDLGFRSCSSNPIELVTWAESQIDELLGSMSCCEGDVIYVPWTLIDPSIEGVVERLREIYHTEAMEWWTIEATPDHNYIMFS